MAYSVAVTSQGQISIPAHLRRKFGFDKSGRAQVTEEAGKLIIEPVKDLLELRGSLKSRKPKVSPALIRQGFEKYFGAQASRRK